MGEIVFHLGLLVFFVSFYIRSFTFKVPKGIRVTIGPGFWPRLVLGIAIVLTLYSMIKLLVSYVKERKGENKESGKKVSIFKKIKSPSALGPLGIAFFVVIMLMFIYRLGFILSSFFLVLVSMYWIKGKIEKHLMIIGTSVILVLAFVLIFGNMLSIALPRGVGIFRELSYIFY